MVFNLIWPVTNVYSAIPITLKSETVPHQRNRRQIGYLSAYTSSSIFFTQPLIYYVLISQTSTGISIPVIYDHIYDQVLSYIYSPDLPTHKDSGWLKIFPISIKLNSIQYYDLQCCRGPTLEYSALTGQSFLVSDLMFLFILIKLHWVSP